MPAKRFSDRHIRAVHDGRLVDYIRKACLMAGPKKSIYPYVFPTRNPARPPKDETVLAGYYCIDTFTPLNLNAYLAARSAVDCALTAAEKVLEGADLAYALGAAARPSRRDAHLRRLLLFQQRRRSPPTCFRATAASAILDIDYHHGNGQQEIFYNRADVLTVSIHGHPSFAYPYFSGFRDETGTGAGAGYNLNIPLPEHITPEQHRNAVAEGLRRIRRFGPAFLVVSLGFDTARGDPTGTWPNRAQGFRAARPHDRRAGLLDPRGAGGRLSGAHARHQCAQFLQRAGHRPCVGAADGAGAARSAGLARGPHRNGLEWRSAVMADDVGRVRSLVASTGFFNAAEVEVAADLVTERLTKGIRSGYHFVLAERGASLVAYACYGPIEGTQGSFDLYWIAVSPEEQRQGLGAQVYARAESAMRKAGAKQIYADTSSSDRYARHARLLSAHGLSGGCAAADFYAPGDGKIIYVKPLVTLPPERREGRDGVRPLGAASIMERPELVACISTAQGPLRRAAARTPASVRARPPVMTIICRSIMTRARIAGRGFREQALDDGELGTRRHGIAAAFQDGAGRHIVPMLEHALQHIEVGLDGDLGEEIAADEGYALEHAM